MPEYTLVTFKLLWMCSCYFTNMQTRANFMKSSLLLPKCLHHHQFSDAFLIWECQIKICFGCLLAYLFSLSYNVEETSWAMFEFPTSFCKMWGNDPRRCLTLRLTSVLCFGSLWLLQGKLQLKFTTEKRSCPVSMVNRLELSCEITVLAMFSLNFWSLTEKKSPTWRLNL